ncbi:MAG TPA: hypothetical protein VMF51_02620 [Nocardioides sp.]|uniref:hypothetical protein n=1 Tax=Nocardioides sp. TaxID=35761 RepID=UPI002CDBF9E7|nr:hypothetical protein [Nocardioides sp.]HTW13991.1 hypothetical protein [Nocardioides sp.]
MDRDADAPSADNLHVTVDGFDFAITYDASQPGTYHYTRLPGGCSGCSGPAVGYGFSGGRSDGQRLPRAAHVDSIRDFLAMVDPVSGYIEDTNEEDDSGE